MPILFKPIILVCDGCGVWIHAAFQQSPDGQSGGVLMPVYCDAHPLHVKRNEVPHEQGCKGGSLVLERADAGIIPGVSLGVIRKCEVAPPLADVSQGQLVNSPVVVTCLDCRRRAGGKLDQVTDEGDHG